MKFQTIEKIRIYAGKYGFSTSISKNVSTKEEPKYAREYLNVYFEKGKEPKVSQGDYVTINIDSATLELYVDKSNLNHLQIYVKEYTLVK